MKSWFVVASGMVSATPAFAQPASPAPAPDPVVASTESAEEVQAKQLYVAGKRHYDVGDYARAIEIWKQAYLISNAPMLLFNIGQAHRLAGDCAQAMRVYANYEREARAMSNRSQLDEARARCNPQPTGTNPPEPHGAAPPASDARRPTPAAAVALRDGDLEPTTPAPPSPVIQRDADPIPGSTLRHAGLGAAAGGAVLLATSIYFWRRASGLADQVEDYRGEWTSEQRALERDGKSAQTWSIVTGVAGALGLAGGAVLYYAGWRERRTSSLGVAVTASQMEATWTVSF
ncbi:MAG: hypothetical protein AB7O24_01340 [Kofleriaceae bacterium]